LILTLVTIAVVLSLLILPTVSGNNTAYADSIYESYFQPSESECPKELDVLCSIDLAKHPVYLMYNITTNKAESKTYTRIELSVHKNSTGETVPYPAFYVTIYDNNSNASPILNDSFATPNATLVLNVVYADSGNTSNPILIDANGRDPFLNALVPNKSDTINISNVPTTANGNYLMKIELLRVADPHKGIVNPNAETNVAFGTENNANGKVVLVPEFGSTIVMMVVVGVIGSIVVIGRMIRFREWIGWFMRATDEESD
jgi:hypothetical protein